MWLALSINITPALLTRKIDILTFDIYLTKKVGRTRKEMHLLFFPLIFFNYAADRLNGQTAVAAVSESKQYQPLFYLLL